jgi:hypothetical protein
MKREILFRGWSEDLQKWVEGGIYTHQNDVAIIHKHGNNLMQHTPVNPDSVGQFTGMLDIDGNKVFEGMKLHRYLGVYWTVSFKDSKWVAIPETDSGLYLDASQFKECKITGNTFQPN